MKTLTDVTLSVLIVAALFPTESSATRCYVCTKCDIKFDTDKVTVETCTGSCLKKVHDKDGITRECSNFGDTEGCKRTEAIKTTTCICNDDLCNIATKSQMSMTLFFIVFMVMVYRYFS